MIMTVCLPVLWQLSVCHSRPVLLYFSVYCIVLVYNKYIFIPSENERKETTLTWAALSFLSAFANCIYSRYNTSVKECFAKIPQISWRLLHIVMIFVQLLFHILSFPRLKIQIKVKIPRVETYNMRGMFQRYGVNQWCGIK